MTAATEAPDEGLLAKIRALLAKAEATEFPDEAETLTAKAAELMAKYGIEQAKLADAEPDRDPIGDHHRIAMDAPYARDKAQLLNWIAQALGCRVIIHTRAAGISVTLFGFQSDRERAEMLFTSLLVQAAHALAVVEIPWGENKAVYRRTWYTGYAQAIYIRLTEAERRARAAAGEDQAASGKSTALVLADRGAQVEQAWTERAKDLKSAKARRLSGSGVRDGYRAGQRADLGGRKVQAGNRRALGGAQ
jgi:hypothetical protein